MAEGTNPNAEQQPNETDTEATSQTDQSAEAKTNDESANKPANKEAEAKTKGDSADKETKAKTNDELDKSKDKEAEAKTKDGSADKETKAETKDESAKSADKESKAKEAKAKAAKAKSDGKSAGKGKAKKPSPEDKPFPEFIEQEFIPALKEAFTQQGIEDMELNFVKEKLSITGASSNEPCWQVIGNWQNGQRQFNLYFLDEDIKGQKAFSHATSGSQPSTIESFMIDERRVNLDLLVLYTLQRLNGQKWLVRN